MNPYNGYFFSKGTGPQFVQIEAQNSAGVKAQVEARYPETYGVDISGHKMVENDIAETKGVSMGRRARCLWNRNLLS